MPSPFPGMNPYIEQDDVWHDFHQAFLTELRRQIAVQLAPYYIVKIDEHIYIHEPPDDRTVFGRADVFVAADRPLAEEETSITAVATAAPARIAMPAVDVERLPYLEIRDRRDRRVVAVIELLSPSNKYSGADRDQYLKKRGELVAARTHLVEIDLLRGGPRLPFADTLPECAYYVVVSRVDERPEAGLWPIRLRDPLPSIPIPLRDPDPDARVDLQAALHRVYDDAFYVNYIYAASPSPALNAADAAWARQVAGLP